MQWIMSYATHITTHSGHSTHHVQQGAFQNIASIACLQIGDDPNCEKTDRAAQQILNRMLAGEIFEAVHQRGGHVAHGQLRQSIDVAQIGMRLSGNIEIIGIVNGENALIQSTTKGTEISGILSNRRVSSMAHTSA